MFTDDVSMSKQLDEATVEAVSESMKQAVASDTLQDISDVIVLLEKQSPNVRRLLFSRASTLLHLCVREATGWLLDYVLETAANDPTLRLDINARGNIHAMRLSTPLWAAVTTKKPCAVSMLLRHGADVNIECHDASPLLACLQTADIRSTSVGIAEMLIEYGADVTYANSRGVTPLMLSARDYPQLVNTILKNLSDAGQDEINAQDRDGRTALHYATSSKQFNKNVITSLCHRGGDVFARDYAGRDALASCCACFGMTEWTPSKVWHRISELMKAFCAPLVRQWQVWELAGAEVAQWFCWPHYDIEVEPSDETTAAQTTTEYDYVFFLEQALFVRQQLQPEDIPAMPKKFLNYFYEEPATVDALRQLRNDWVAALGHAVQVKRRHLGDGSLAVTIAYNCFSAYLQKMFNTDPADKEAQRNIFAFCARSRLEALSFKPSNSTLRLLKDNETILFERWFSRLTNHLASANALTCHVYCRSHSAPNAVWDDLMLMAKAAVDLVILPGSHSLESDNRHTLLHLLLMATCHLKCADGHRIAALQSVVNGLAKKSSVFVLLFQDAIRERQWHTGINQWHHSSYLPLACVRMIVKAAHYAGVIFDPCQQGVVCITEALLFLCARLIDDPHTTDARKAELRCIMEMLVEDGGAHWDVSHPGAAGVCTVIHHYTNTAVARYMNLQCLAARVIRRHSSVYKHIKVGSAEAAFVNLH